MDIPEDQAPPPPEPEAATPPPQPFQSTPMHLANEVIMERFDGDVWDVIHRLATVVEMHHNALLDLSASDVFNKAKKGAMAVKNATVSAKNATVSATKSAYNLYKTVTTEIHTAGIEDQEDPSGAKYGDMSFPGTPRTLRQLIAEDLPASAAKIQEFTAKLNQNQVENKAVTGQVTRHENIDIERYKAHCIEYQELTNALMNANITHNAELSMAKVVLAKLQQIQKANTDKMLKQRKLQREAEKASAASAVALEVRKDEKEEKREETDKEFKEKKLEADKKNEMLEKAIEKVREDKKEAPTIKVVARPKSAEPRGDTTKTPAAKKGLKLKR